MMTDREILSEIEQVARRHLGWEGTLSPEQRLVEDLELDSIRSLALAVEVENRFEICLDPEAESRLVTVRDLVALIRREVAATHDPD